jgi:hypothetical protein
MKNKKASHRHAACPENRMDKRSTRGMAGEWRGYWLSGQARCRTSTGAVLRAVPLFQPLQRTFFIGIRFFRERVASPPINAKNSP